MPRIIAFTKDWNDVPTCTTHVLRCMARSMPVLWIESIGTRRPNLASGKDLARVWRKLRRAMAPAEIKENNLRVLTPALIPKTGSAAGRLANRWVMRRLIGRELRRMGEGPAEYWCFVPNAVDLLPKPGSQGSVFGVQVGCPRVIYYCVDDWSAFHNLDGAWLAAKEAEMLKRADVVFTPARHLEEKCRRIAGNRVHYVPHGVEFDVFARALAPETRAPEDAIGLRRPRIGFYGNLHPWVDFALLGELARRKPEWSFILIGTVFCEVSMLEKLPNVHFLGRREHAELPAYCSAFDAAIIPYDMKQPRMESVNPVKTKELLAAGVPIVAADVPELRGYGDDVTICRGADEWIAALTKQIARRDRAEISRRVAGEDWAKKVAALRRIVESAALGPR